MVVLHLASPARTVILVFIITTRFFLHLIHLQQVHATTPPHPTWPDHSCLSPTFHSDPHHYHPTNQASLIQSSRLSLTDSRVQLNHASYHNLGGHLQSPFHTAPQSNPPGRGTDHPNHRSTQPHDQQLVPLRPGQVARLCQTTAKHYLQCQGRGCVTCLTAVMSSCVIMC